MKTVKEVSRLTGVSVRTLQYYDRIGLLKPAARTEAGYRLYDDASLERLQQILLFRELEFSLREIRSILNAPDFDRNRALEQQIELLMLKREHLDNLINLARRIKLMGVTTMDFSAFDTHKLDDYAAQAKAAWGQTEAYREFEEKSRDWTDTDKKSIENWFAVCFGSLGTLKKNGPGSPEAQAWVKELQAYITEHFYTCTDKILAGLGKMYGGGGEFTENIDAAGGEGAAAFAAEAIRIHCET